MPTRRIILAACVTLALAGAVSACDSSDDSNAEDSSARAGDTVSLKDWGSPIDEAMRQASFELTYLSGDGSGAVGTIDCQAGTWTEVWPDPAAPEQGSPGDLPCTVTSSLVMSGAESKDLAARDVRVVDQEDGVEVVELLDATGAPSGVTASVDREHHLRAVVADGRESRFTAYDSDAPTTAGDPTRFNDFEGAVTSGLAGTFHVSALVERQASLTAADCGSDSFQAFDEEGQADAIIINGTGWSRQSTESQDGGADGYVWSPISDVERYEYLPHACDLHGWLSLLVGYQSDYEGSYDEVVFRRFELANGQSLIQAEGLNGDLSLTLSAQGRLVEISSEVDESYYRGFFDRYGQRLLIGKPSPVAAG